MEQVPLTYTQIRYIMNLMMGDYHSSQTRLYNHLESHLQDDESRAAKLEITVDYYLAEFLI